MQTGCAQRIRCRAGSCPCLLGLLQPAACAMYHIRLSSCMQCRSLGMLVHVVSMHRKLTPACWARDRRVAGHCAALL